MLLGARLVSCLLALGAPVAPCAAQDARLSESLDRARSGDGAARRAAAEELLAKPALLRELARSARPADEPFLYEVANMAFERKFPGSRSARGDGEREFAWLDNLGDAEFFECNKSAMQLDELAAEIRWSRALPFPMFVGTTALAEEVQLGAATFQSEFLTLTSLARIGVTFHPYGSDRSGDNAKPSFLLLGSVIGAPAAAPCETWLRLWRSGTDDKPIVRAATALVGLELAPFDELVIEGLEAQRSETQQSQTQESKTQQNESRPAGPRPAAEVRFAAAFRAARDNPAAGASLLAKRPKALDAFAREALSAPPNICVFRLLSLLPQRDASGRDLDGWLAGLGDTETQRNWMLAVLARRRAAAARARFEEAARSASPRAASVGLLGLFSVDPEAGVAEAWKALARADDPELLLTAARIARADPQSTIATLKALGEAAGLRGAAIAALRLSADDKDSVAAGVRAIEAMSDPAALSLVNRILEPPPPRATRERIWSALAQAAARGEAGPAIVAANLDIVPKANADAIAELLLSAKSPAPVELCHAAAGRLASTRLAVEKTRAAFAQMKQSRGTQQLGAQQPATTQDSSAPFGAFFAAHWRRLSRADRNGLLEKLTAGENAPLAGYRPNAEGRIGLVDLGDWLAAAAQPDLVTERSVVRRENDGRIRVERAYVPAVDRGRPFPDVDALFRAVFP
jgi:hypothetical protein